MTVTWTAPGHGLPISEVAMSNQNQSTKRTLQKIEDLMEYAEPIIIKFPGPEKGYSGMMTKLRVCMQTMAERAMDAEKSYYAKSALKELAELDKAIEHTRFYTKHAMRRKLLSLKQYGVMHDYLDEIGKMTGGWINTIMESEKKRQKK